MSDRYKPVGGPLQAITINTLNLHVPGHKRSGDQQCRPNHRHPHSSGQQARSVNDCRTIRGCPALRLTWGQGRGRLQERLEQRVLAVGNRVQSLCLRLQTRWRSMGGGIRGGYKKNSWYRRTAFFFGGYPRRRGGGGYEKKFARKFFPGPKT